MQTLWELHGKQEVRQERSQKSEGKREPCTPQLFALPGPGKMCHLQKWMRKEILVHYSTGNAKHKGYALVCKECRKRGGASRNPALYTCTTCSEMFGAAKLDAINFTYFKQHGRTTLTCSNCIYVFLVLLQFFLQSPYFVLLRAETLI